MIGWKATALHQQKVARDSPGFDLSHQARFADARFPANQGHLPLSAFRSIDEHAEMDDLLYATDHDWTDDWGRKPCLHRLLSFHQSQLFFHLCAADLCIPHSGLNGGGAFHRDMPEIVGDLFKGPSRLTGAMGKIVTQIMKAQGSDQLPFFLVCLLLEHTKPGVNTVLGEV